ncbi:MAG: ATP-binding cassette domain-containing protein [Myxococcales bacterium]|nr:ATP-binding cassette domain-containing protein [Myxococcales bacterium]
MNDAEPDPSGKSATVERASLTHFVAWTLAQAWRSWGLSLVVLACFAVALVGEVAMPFGLKVIIDDVIPAGDLALLAAIAGALGVVIVLRLIAGVAEDWSLATLGARVMARARRGLFMRLQAQPAGFYATRDASEVLSVFGGDLRELELTATITLPSLLHNAASLLFGLGILYFIEWRLALAVSVLLVLAMAAPGPLLGRSFVAEDRRQRANQAVLEVIEENIATHRVIRVFQLQEARRRHLQRRLDRLTRDTVAAGLWGGLVGRIAGSLVRLIEVGVVAGGAWLVISGELTLGLLVTFFHLFLNTAYSLRGLLSLTPMATRGASNLARFEALMSIPPGLADKPGAEPAPPLREAIELRAVSYDYGDGRRAVDDVSLRIAAGERVAFVGPSGSGKSTMLALLSRLHDPTVGAVTIDGHDLRDITEASLRAQSAFVLQESYLFDASIRENVRVGDLDADDQAITRALERADAAAFVRALPEGLGTAVRRSGALSGGQRQRIAIARALVRDPQLLILDEATSALDPATEHAITQTLDAVTRGRTVISVTHRLRTTIGCDQIFVMESGRLVEHGTHGELLARGGVYRDLWEKQSGFAVSAEGDVAAVTPARLRQIPLFSTFDDDRLALLAEALVPERFRDGDVIVEEGDEGDRFYLIARGKAEAVQRDGGRERVLRSMGDGDHFGEIAIVEKVPRTATVRARAHTICLSLSRDAFSRLLAEESELSRTIASTIAERRASTGDQGRAP